MLISIGLRGPDPVFSAIGPTLSVPPAHSSNEFQTRSIGSNVIKSSGNCLI